ncbi:HAD family hydrolase [Myceligenerans pegani]|uniref:HAD family phosphatase n=1 Tax=Myceligenerans pegani TaxID=2776917 RepID=A0ABR9MTV2_9MICO|nr:HAD family hydrolase [Myceligenerans sp. TRM 65318]MBE1874803.1 HAD family phosphatase [Myceligenerans sp. TRM 65318]MBE3017074.1 HAD family phosphatase [Myceligenerans sp. TRM 65318]
MFLAAAVHTVKSMTPGTTPHLLAFDIDGTLAETGRPPSDTVVDAARAAVGAGHHLALATGRSLVGAISVALQLGLRRGWIASSNGAVTARIGGGKVTIVERHLVDVEAVVRYVAPKARLRIAAEIPGHGYRTAGTFGPRELPGVLQPSNLEGLWSAPTPRVALVGEGAAWLVDGLQELGVTAHALNSEWVDVTCGGVSKATAMERIRVALGVPVSATVAVGDSGNDVDMLRWAARGVAMAHAPVHVRRAANEVTGTLAEDGAAYVLRSITGRQVGTAGVTQ